MFRTTLYKIKKSWTYNLPSRYLRFCSKNSRLTPAGTQKLPTCVLQKEKSTDATRDGKEKCVCGHCLPQHFHCNCDMCLRILQKAIGPQYLYKNSCCKCTRGEWKQHLQNSNHRQKEDKQHGEMKDINTNIKNNIASNENVALIKTDEMFDKNTQTKVDNIKQIISAEQFEMNAANCNTGDSSQGTTAPKHLDSSTNKTNKFEETRNTDMYLNFNKNINKVTGSDSKKLAIRCLDSPHCEIDQRLPNKMSIQNMAKDKLRSKYKVDAVQCDKTVQAKETKEVKETQLCNKDREYVVKNSSEKSKSKSYVKNITKHDNMNKEYKNLHHTGFRDTKRDKTNRNSLEANNITSKRTMEVCDSTSLAHNAYYKKPAVFNLNKLYTKANKNVNETKKEERHETYEERMQSFNKDSRAKIVNKLNQNSYNTYYRKPVVYNFNAYSVKAHENRNIQKKEVIEKTNEELLQACTVNSKTLTETYYNTSSLNSTGYYKYYKRPKMSDINEYYIKGDECKKKTINETKEETKKRDIGEAAIDPLSYPSCIPTRYQNSLKVIQSEVEKTADDEKLQPPARPVSLSPDLITLNENTSDITKLEKFDRVDNAVTKAVKAKVVKPLKVDLLSTLNSENLNSGDLKAVKSSEAVIKLSDLLQKVRKQNKMRYGKEMIKKGKKNYNEKQTLPKIVLHEAVVSNQPQCPPPCPPPPPKPCPPPKPACPPPAPTCPPPPPPPPCPPPCPPPPPPCPPPPCPSKDPCKKICPTLPNPHTHV